MQTSFWDVHALGEQGVCKVFCSYTGSGHVPCKVMLLKVNAGSRYC